MKIKYRLIGAFLIIAFAIAIVGYVSVVISQNALEKEIGNSQLEITKQTMDKVDRVLYGALNDIKLVGKAGVIESELAEGTSFEGSQKKIDELIYLTGPWDELEIFDKNRIMVVSTNKDDFGEEIEEQDKTEIEAFDEALEGNSYYSDLIISKDTGKPTIVFAVPVKNEGVFGSPVVGVVAGAFSWQVIIEILDKLETDEVHLLNKEGYAIFDPDEPALIHNHKDSEVFQHTLEGEDHSGILKNIHGGEFEALTSHVNEKGYLTYKGNDWVLVLEIPVNVAFAPIDTLKNTLLTILFGIAVFASLLGLFVSRSISVPLKKLEETAKEITQGNLNKRVEIKSKDEIGELAKSFNIMAENLVQIGEQSKAVIETFPEPLFILDKEGKVTSVNKKAIEATGFNELELEGKLVSEIFQTKATNSKKQKKKIITYIPDPNQKEEEEEE